jgi:excisionase family DNA binding protein
VIDGALVGTGEAARLAGISRLTVIRWYDAGMVDGYVLPSGGHRRISLASLRQLLADNGNPTAAVDAAIAKNSSAQ